MDVMMFHRVERREVHVAEEAPPLGVMNTLEALAPEAPQHHLLPGNRLRVYGEVLLYTFIKGSHRAVAVGGNVPIYSKRRYVLGPTASRRPNAAYRAGRVDTSGGRHTNVGLFPRGRG